MLANAQWEKFAQSVAQGMELGLAYEAAGYRATGNAAQVNGCRLMKRAEIAQRVKELQSKSAEQVGVTVESLIALGLEIIRDARAAEDFSAASSTYERLAKISGHWVDRSEQKSTVTRLVSDRPQKPMDEQEWLSTHAPGARPN